MINKDNIILVLLIFIVIYYVTLLFYLKLKGYSMAESPNKEVIIYILGIISGAIYKDKLNNKDNGKI